MQGRFAKATSDLRHYPLEFKVLDAEGKELHTQTVKDPGEMDGIRPTLAASILEPGAASIEYKARRQQRYDPGGPAIQESANIKEIKPKAARTAKSKNLRFPKAIPDFIEANKKPDLSLEFRIG